MNDDGECYKKSSFRLPRQTEQAYFTYYAVIIFSVLGSAKFQTHTH